MSEKYVKLIEEIKKDFKNFEIVDKQESKLMKFIYYGSLMPLWNPKFLTDYTTTMFGKVYMQKRYMNTDGGYRILRHELIHLEDSKKYPILFELSYLFLLPIVFTIRTYWEYRAFKETIRAIHDTQGYVSKNQLNWILKQFTGSAYLFMFPFRKTLEKKFKEFMLENNIDYSEEL